MALPNTKQIVFEDFSAGIVSETRGVGGKLLTQPGPADASATYRCIALPSGGLGPLPRSRSSITITNPGAVTPKENRFVNVGLEAIPQVFPTGGTASTAVLTDELHYGLVWADSGSPFNASLAWYLKRIVDDTAVQLKLLNTTTPGSPLTPTPLFFARTRLRSSSAVLNHSIVASWEDQLGTNPRFWFWPDPSSPSSTTPVESTARSGFIIPHDGSILLFDWQSTTHGTGVNLSNEFLCYTSPPLSTSLGSQGLLFDPTNPSGYGAVTTNAQSQLFLVHPDRGVVIVGGDFSTPNPQTVLAPFAAGCGKTIQRALPTPFGIVYTDETAVYLWDGSTTQSISSQLEDSFFIPADIIAGQIFAPAVFNNKYISSACWNNWVVLPNNYLFDGKGWWRLDASTDEGITNPITHYAVGGSTSILYGTTGSFTPGTGVVYAFDSRLPATSYTWTSHPIPSSQNHYIDVREVEIVAQAAAGTSASTVIISLRDADNNLVSETFTLTSTLQPMRIRKPTYIKGYNVRMGITSASNQANVAAPTVLQVILGVRDSHTTAPT